MKKITNSHKIWIKRISVSPEVSWKRAGFFLQKMNAIDELVRLAQSEKAKITGMSQEFNKEVECIIKTGKLQQQLIIRKKESLEHNVRNVIRLLDTINKKGFNIHELKKINNNRLPITLKYLGILRKNEYIDEKGNVTKKGKQFLEKYKHMLR